MASALDLFRCNSRSDTFFSSCPVPRVLLHGAGIRETLGTRLVPLADFFNTRAPFR